MSDQKRKDLQKLLNRMCKDSQKASEIAKELFGGEAHLFAEDIGLYVMAGDCDGSAMARQKFIRMEANTHWVCGGGAW